MSRGSEHSLTTLSGVIMARFFLSIDQSKKKWGRTEGFNRQQHQALKMKGVRKLFDLLILRRQRTALRTLVRWTPHTTLT